MKSVGAILAVIGYLYMALAVISGIGHWLYLMGVAGATFGPAAWAGFVLFLKMLGGGFVTLVVGAVMAASQK